MFSIFTILEGSLIIRAIDIRSLADTDHGCRLMWEPIPGKEYAASILGTAEENLNRLKQEETDALIAAEKIRQRQSSGYPPEPIQRGKQALRMVPK
jgi:hypothetical protein